MHKLTSKRQVTLPRAVCDALGLTPGDYVEVFERDGVAHLVKMHGESLAGKFAGLGAGKDVSPDAVKQALRARAGRKFEATRGRR
ncbi:MAG: AbrB/MazE/SpoVT family DNA-binding domain-containing protein [Gammaproteobacteria bacterium]